MADPVVTNPDVTWAVEEVRRRLEPQAKSLAYYEGRHSLTFATEKFRNAFGALFSEFADNLCDDVVDEPVDRMQITSWTSAQEDVAKAAADLWENNRGDSRAGSVHLNGYRSGDGWLIVWEDSEGTPRMYPQDPDKMACRYSKDQPDVIEVAAKVWREGRTYRLTLYYADRIERYTTRGTTNDGGLPQAKAFIPLTVEANADGTGGQDWLEPHERGRVPVFHFPEGEPGRYGRSVLADVYPLQDALNKSVADMLVAMEFHAFPQRWATGIQVERDPVTGDEIVPFKGGAERLLRTANDKAQFGQFAQADLTQFLEVQDGWRLEIARKGGLPAHSITLRGGGGGNVASGLALLVAEGKLIKRIRDRERDWGMTWREAMAFALQITGMSVTAADLDLDWAPPETRDEKAMLEALVIKRELGISKKQALLEAGYEPDQVQEFLDAAEEAAPDFGPAAGRPPMAAADRAVIEQGLGLPPAPAGAPGAPAPALAR